MGSSGSCFRPFFLFLLLTAVTTIIMMAFYYRSSALVAPLPSEGPARESLAARSLMGTVDVFKPYTGEQPLLTMFTTFKNVKDRFQIHANVLHNWALFIPVVQPILFIYETDVELTGLAKKLGWLVVQSPRVSSSGVPYFKEMYFEAQKQVNSVFYGYFNGDLLFDDGLVNTLMVVERYVDQLHKTLIVGQRMNFPVKGKEIYRKAEVSAMSRSKGKLFRSDAEDFFIIAHNSFIWEKIADVVIGRPAYDNYIVGMAIMHKVAVVDATKTLLALHQSGIDGDYAGHKNKDFKFNFKAIGPFNWGRGVTSASQYFTRNKDGHIELWQRSPAKILIAKVRTTAAPPITKATVSPTISRAENKTLTYYSASNHTTLSGSFLPTLHNSTLQSLEHKIAPLPKSSDEAANLTLESNKGISSIQSNSPSNAIITKNFDSSSKHGDASNYRTVSRSPPSVIQKDNSTSSLVTSPYRS